MGFTEIEAAGKRALEQFPVIKRSAKRAYQVVSVAANPDKLKAEGDITRVSPDDGYEYFYGYYDKSPWDATDRYMICVRVQQAYKSVAPKEPGTVCLIDTENGNRVIEIGATHAWNVQQSCMAQWLGPDFKSRLIYNDFRDGRYCSVVFNVEAMKEEKVLPLPVYDVSRDGSFALSLDFNRLHRMRPGYGYSNLPDTTKGDLCPDKTCIWRMDTQTGKTEELFKYTDFAAFEPDDTMKGAEHKVNHLMISPNGKRFMVLHRWFDRGRKHTRLVTVNVDKTEMYNLSDDVFVSHCYWKNDEEILSFLRKKESGDHYYLLKDKTQQYTLFWPELNTDGHCSYSPDGRFIITDTYPNRKRIASVYLCTEEDDRSRRIARVFSPFKYDNDCRCDLHPRWNREGDKICIDSVHEGKRGLYVIPIAKYTESIKFVDKKSDMVSPLISFVIPVYNAQNTIGKCIESVMSQTCPSWEIVAVDDGSTDETVQELEKYVSSGKVHIIRQANSGPGFARNQGIKHVKGEYVFCLDADDFIEPSFVEEVKKRVEKTDADVVFIDVFYEIEDRGVSKISRISRYCSDSRRDFITKQMGGCFSWAGWTKVIKTKLIKESSAAYSKEDIGEDSLFTFTVLTNAQRIEFIKKPLYHYIQTAHGQHKKGSDDPLNKACQIMKEYMQDNGLLEEYLPALNCMAYKAVSQSVYRCAMLYGYFKARKRMTEKLNYYHGEYDLKHIETDKLNRSAKLLYPFVKFRMVDVIYAASRIRKPYT